MCARPEVSGGLQVWRVERMERVSDGSDVRSVDRAAYAEERRPAVQGCGSVAAVQTTVGLPHDAGAGSCTRRGDEGDCVRGERVRAVESADVRWGVWR